MLEQWDKYFPNNEKLRKRVYKGIPNSLRGEVWTRLMEVPQVKKEQEGTNNHFSFPHKFKWIKYQIDVTFVSTFTLNH